MRRFGKIFFCAGLGIAFTLFTACEESSLWPTPRALSTPAGIQPAATIADLSERLPGRIVFTRGDSALWLTEPASSATPRKILTVQPNLSIESPAWSQDGRWIAYNLTRRITESGWPESDLYLVSSTGEDPRVLLAHQQVGEQLLAPLWSDDDRAILFSQFTLEQKGAVRVGVWRVVRLDLSTMEQTILLKDAVYPSLSPNRDLIFVHMDPNTFAQSLWISQRDSNEARPLLNRPPRGVLLAPRFSPDGHSIVMASSSPLLGKVDFPIQTHPTGNFLNFASVARAHGDPFDLWIIQVRNQSIRRLTNIGEDMPRAAWSPDNRWIAFTGAQGIYVIDAEGRTLLWLDRVGGHGQIDWGGK